MIHDCSSSRKYSQLTARTAAGREFCFRGNTAWYARTSKFLMSRMSVFQNGDTAYCPGVVCSTGARSGERERGRNIHWMLFAGNLTFSITQRKLNVIGNKCPTRRATPHHHTNAREHEQQNAPIVHRHHVPCLLSSCTTPKQSKAP